VFRLAPVASVRKQQDWWLSTCAIWQEEYNKLYPYALEGLKL